MSEQFLSAAFLHNSAAENAYSPESCYILSRDMKLNKIDRWITDLTEGLTNANGKLNQVADLDLTLGANLDRIGAGLEKLAAFSTRTEQKIESASAKLEALAGASTRTAQKIDRVLSATPPRESGGA